MSNTLGDEKNTNWQATARYKDGRQVAIWRGYPGTEFEGKFYLRLEKNPPSPARRFALGDEIPFSSLEEVRAMFTAGELSLLRGTVP